MKLLIFLFNIPLIQCNPNDKYLNDEEYREPISEKEFQSIPWWEDTNKIVILTIIVIVFLVLCWLTYTTEKAKQKNKLKQQYTEEQLEKAT